MAALQMDVEQMLAEQDRRLTTLETESKERWKSQFMFNKDVKKAIENFVERATADRVRLAVFIALAAASGAGVTNWLQP